MTPFDHSLIYYLFLSGILFPSIPSHHRCATHGFVVQSNKCSLILDKVHISFHLGIYLGFSHSVFTEWCIDLWPIRSSLIIRYIESCEVTVLIYMTPVIFLLIAFVRRACSMQHKFWKIAFYIDFNETVIKLTQNLICYTRIVIRLFTNLYLYIYFGEVFISKTIRHFLCDCNNCPLSAAQ